MGHSYHDAFHEADGSLTGITEFPYDDVDRNLSGEPMLITPREGRALLKIARWIDQDGARNLDGIAIRAIIFNANILPEKRAMSLTDLSLAYGKHKQSLGRWVDRWKMDFPQARTPHMR